MEDDGHDSKFARHKKVFIEPRGGGHEALTSCLSMYLKHCEKCNAMAVFRGKISEGIDFSDRYARAVLIVGIPYPSFADVRVKLKKAHLDSQAVGKVLPVLLLLLRLLL